MRNAVLLVGLMTTLLLAPSARSEPTTGAAAPAWKLPRPLTHETFCGESPDELMATTIIATTYTFDAATAKQLGRSGGSANVLWSLRCNRKSRECEGAKFDLHGIESKGHVSHWDISMLQGVRIATNTGKVYVIEWGPYRTLTVDLARREVLYRESGPTTEGVGRGACQL